ncbi:uncharacterized protein BDFB_000901 [Asbolus verrucosus]|uniref:Uncharacterized protein n=1 Tax=Asbolus verrucosus TaxID=1661398 RepID=A0A482VQC1_ASBVE|nr:uncharacterized protein BDFB_000901 [Asbolus verrucosus]
MSDYSELPFFPKNETIHLQNHPEIRVTFFEPKFSQSHYNYQNVSISSNACTLIAVLMASYCKHEMIIINKPDKCINVRLIHLLAYSILDGNKIHENLKANGTLDNFNLTVPEAMKFAGYRAEGLVEWVTKLTTIRPCSTKSMIYMESLFHSLYANIKTNLIEWSKTIKNKYNNPDLYIILIADNRSVLFILQKETVTLVDSHQHSDNKGAFIAVSSTEKFNILCLWYSHIINKCYKCDPSLYELSFLYFHNKENSQQAS